MKRIKRAVQRRRSTSTGPEPVVTLSVPRTDLHALATDLGHPPAKSGLLLKYTNVVKRWKPRFFTLENGVLVYSAPTGDDIDDYALPPAAHDEHTAHTPVSSATEPASALPAAAAAAASATTALTPDYPDRDRPRPPAPSAAAAAARRKAKKKRILRRAPSKDDRDRDIKGQINLQFAVVSPDDSDACRFAIDVGNDVFHCKADSPDERDDWVTALTRSIDYFRGLIERAVERAKEPASTASRLGSFADSPSNHHPPAAKSASAHAAAASSPAGNPLANGQVSEESEESILEDDGLKEAEQSRKALLSELRRVLTLWRDQWVAPNAAPLTDAQVLQTLAHTFPDVSAATQPPSPHQQQPNSSHASREIAKGLIDLVTWCAHILQTNDQMFDRRLNADITRLMNNNLPVFPTSPQQQRLGPVPSMPESDFPAIDSDSDDEFVDALSRAASKRSSFAHQLAIAEQQQQHQQHDVSPTSVTTSPRVHSLKSGSDAADSLDAPASNGIHRISTKQLSKAVSRPRTHLPDLTNGSREKLNIFGILKDSVGKDLSKITLPVGLNEPLSFVQRLAEDIEYCELLDRGAAEPDPNRRMMYVAAMVISHYSSTQGRVGKPFNPLLGETACLVRPDKGKGVRFLSEQVSHHPPISACYAEGSGGSWKYYNAIEVKNKFWGKSLEVFPTGLNHIEFPEHGDHYVLEQVTACVHNIVVGRMWLDNYGEMEIVNRTNGGRCVINFAKTGWMSDANSFAAIKGTVYDAKGKAKIKLGGNWTKSVYEDLGRGKREPIWQVDERPPDGASQSYNMTKWAITLNAEVTDDERKMLPPTDSRLRPDQRALEQGQNDFGSRIKQALEEGQRTRRREMEEAGGQWKPLWFDETTDPVTGQVDYRFNDKFFKQQAAGDWSMCTDIFECAKDVQP